MKKLGLRFNDPATETEYMRSKEPFTRNFIKLLIGLTSFLLLLSIIRAIINHTAFLVYFLPVFLIVLVIIYIFYRRLHKIIDEFLLVFCLALYGSSIYLFNSGLEGLSPFRAFYSGYLFCMFQTLVEGRLSKIYCIFLLYAGFLAIRLVVIPPGDTGTLLTQVFMEMVLLFANYERENSTRKLYGQMHDDKQDLLKFKDLITSYIPTNIVIFNTTISKVLFVNEPFQNSFNCSDIENIKVLLSNFVTDIDSLQNQESNTRHETVHTMASLLCPSLMQTLQNFMHLPKSDQSILTFNARSTLNEQQSEVFQTKLLRLQWNNQEAIALMLNDLTQQETILRLKLADRQKDKVIATVSHELRTPVNAIIGLIGIIEKMISDSKVLFHLSACKYSANLLLSLVNSILDISQIRANSIKICPTLVDLHQILEEIKQIFSFQCLQKGIEFRFDLAKDLPKIILTDKNRLCQIIINLLNNALKFTFEGSVTLKVENHQEDATKIVFHAIDTGIGIKQEDQEKLGKMFGRLEQAESSVNTQGVGLGLTIANELVKLLNLKDDVEKVTIVSEYTQGSTFSFAISKKLPCSQMVRLESIDDLTVDDEECTRLRLQTRKYKFLRKTTSKLISSRNATLDCYLNQDSATARNDLQPNLIKRSSGYKPWSVLVDDNPFNLMVARHILEEKGYQVKTALNGREAIKVVQEHYQQGETIQFILMDCQMPVMDGFEATSVLVEMMEKGVIPKTPIIALSANNSEHDLEMARKAGMCGFLVKPFDEGELVKILRLNTT